MVIQNELTARWTIMTVKDNRPFALSELVAYVDEFEQWPAIADPLFWLQDNKIATTHDQAIVRNCRSEIAGPDDDGGRQSGNVIAASAPMIEITTNNSITVTPRRVRSLI